MKPKNEIRDKWTKQEQQDMCYKMMRKIQTEKVKIIQATKDEKMLRHFEEIKHSMNLERV